MEKVELEDFENLLNEDISLTDIVLNSKNKRNILTCRKYILQMTLNSLIKTSLGLEVKIKVAFRNKQLTIEQAMMIPRWQKSLKNYKRFIEITQKMIEEVNNKLKQPSSSSSESLEKT